jgi:hypothetical protein
MLSPLVLLRIPLAFLIVGFDEARFRCSDNKKRSRPRPHLVTQWRRLLKLAVPPIQGCGPGVPGGADDRAIVGAAEREVKGYMISGR